MIYYDNIHYKYQVVDRSIYTYANIYTNIYLFIPTQPPLGNLYHIMVHYTR